VGILHVDEEHRRFGLGLALLKEATKALLARSRNGDNVYAFILDGNHASEALFTKLGWEKVGDSSAKGTG
jgi:L-amino acid N-acyltransferase YncA